MEAKKFRFKFSSLVIALMVLAILVVATGLVLNVRNFLEYIPFNTIKAVTYGIITILDLALLVFLTALIVYPYYVFDDIYLKIRLGVFIRKIKLSDITKVTVFKKSKKLVVYFNTTDYTVILINERKYQLFIDQLRAFNHNIFYDENDESEKI